MKNMSKLLYTWVLPIIIVIIVMVLVFGVKLNGLSSLVVSLKRKLLNTKIDLATEQVSKIETKIQEINSSEVKDVKKIEELKVNAEETHKQIESHKADLDALDSVLGSLL